jgi:hypothetical protein
VIQTHHLVHLWKIIWNFQDKTSINGLKFQETKIAKYEKRKHKSTIAFVWNFQTSNLRYYLSNTWEKTNFRTYGRCLQGIILKEKQFTWNGKGIVAHIFPSTEKNSCYCRYILPTYLINEYHVPKIFYYGISVSYFYRTQSRSSRSDWMLNGGNFNRTCSVENLNLPICWKLIGPSKHIMVKTYLVKVKYNPCCFVSTA